MNDKDQNCDLDIGDEITGRINKPSSSKNTTFYSMNNLDTSQSILEHNQYIDDPMKYFDSRHMSTDQGFFMMNLKMDEYRRVLAERDYTIKSLHTYVIRSQHNYTLTNQNENTTENLKSEIDNCARLETCFTNICEHFDLLEDKIDNTKTGYKEVTNLVNHTANKFKANVLNISNKIQDLLKQADMERTRIKKEQNVLKNKYSPDLISIKINLKECTEEINNLKIENHSLLIKLNEVNFKLNEEEETVLSLKQHFENKLGELESNNILLNNLYKSKNIEYEEIKIKNQFLKDELSIMKTSIDENQINLDVQLNIITEQIELLDNLKLSEELNDKLKNDNCILNERNDYLKKINTDLMDDLSNNKISENKSQEEMENKLKNMCKSYNDLLKIQEEKLLDITEKLKLQKENEDNAQNEVVNLKQEAEVCNKTIINLQEESKANFILIPELQSKIDDLNNVLSSNNQKLQESSLEFMSENNVIEKEIYELKNQSKKHFEKIDKLTFNYMKYKSKVKQMYIEVMRLRHKLKSESKSSELPSTIQTIEDNVSIVEPIDVSNINVSVHSISNIINQSSYSSSKRNDSPSAQLHNSRLKMLTDTSGSLKTTISTKNLSQKNDVLEIESSLTVSLKSNNLSYNNILERSIEYNPNVKALELFNNTPQKDNFVVNNKSKIQVNKSISNSDTNFVNKKMFKIPAELKRLSQKKRRPRAIK